MMADLPIAVVILRMPVAGRGPIFTVAFGRMGTLFTLMVDGVSLVTDRAQAATVTASRSMTLRLNFAFMDAIAEFN